MGGRVLHRRVTAVGSGDLGMSLTYINEEFIFLSLESAPLQLSQPRDIQYVVHEIDERVLLFVFGL